MNLTKLNPKQIGYSKTQIRPEQIMDHNDSITYTPNSTGTLTISSGTTAHALSGSHFMQMHYPISLKDIQRFRKEVKDLPHPCLSFFLKCFNQDNTVTAIYNGDHVICKSEECYFDNIEFDPEVTKHQTCISLNKESLVNIIISFNQLSLAEIEILIRYLKQ